MEKHVLRSLNQILLNISLIMNEHQTIPIFERYVSVFANVHDTEPREMKLSEFLDLGKL